MKTFTSAIDAHILQNVTTLAVCWQITSPRTLEIKRFTSHSRNLPIGGNIFSSTNGYTPGQITTTLNLAVDNLDVSGFLSASGFTRNDLLAGVWDFSAVRIFEVDYTSPDSGELKLRKGWTGEVQLVGEGFQAEIRGITDRLKTKFIELTSAECRADVGDTRCKVRMNPPTWTATTAYTVRASFSAETGSVVKPTTQNGRHFKCTVAGTSAGTEPTWDTGIGNTTVDGTVTWQAFQAFTLNGTVTSVTDERIFNDTSRTEANEFWTSGKLTWLTGANAKVEIEVKRSLATGVISLAQPMFFTISVGDTYIIEAGCEKSRAICISTFDNIVNIRAEPDVKQRSELSATSL